MGKLKDVKDAVSDTAVHSAQMVSELVSYTKEQITCMTYNSRFDNFESWWQERRIEELVPPDLRIAYVSFCKSKKNRSN